MTLQEKLRGGAKGSRGRKARWVGAGVASIAALGTVASIVTASSAGAASPQMHSWEAANHGCAYISAYAVVHEGNSRILRVNNDCGHPVKFVFYRPANNLSTSTIKMIGTGARNVDYRSPWTDIPPGVRLEIR